MGAWLLSALLLGGAGVAGAEASDSRLNIACDIDSAFTLANKQEEEREEVSVLIFVNIHSDTSFFMLDDVNNSQWADDAAVRVTAVDVTGADSETLALYSKGFSDSSLRLISDSENLVRAFAEEARLEYEALSYPFTVVLDGENRIRYAMEGYRAPDTLKGCVQEAVLKPAVPQNASAYCTEAGTAILSWQSNPLVGGYEIWRAAEDGGYQHIFSTVSASQSAYADTGLEIGESYSYKIRSFIEGEGGKRYSGYTPVLSAKIVSQPSLPLKIAPLSDGKRQISWASIADAEGYEVYRFESAVGPFCEVFTLSSQAAPRFADFAGTNYFYLVRPVYSSSSSS